MWCIYSAHSGRVTNHIVLAALVLLDDRSTQKVEVID